MRALKAIRLSVKTDETTSPERQDEAITAEAKRRGMTIVGEAADLNVSASKTGPFERPELGKWLTPARAGEYDAIIWWRLDRAVRSMSDLHKLGDWARTYRKRLIFASGPAGGELELDMSSATGQLIAMILAFAAQMEAQAIKERVTGTHAYLRREARWAGGKPPYGFRAVERAEGSGWTLEIDPGPAELIREAVNRVIRGESVNSVCADLNRRGILSPSDYHRDANGGETKQSPWVATSLMKILRSRAMLGYVMHNGKPVAGTDGMPLARVEPAIISHEDFERLQRVLDDNSRVKRRTQATSLLLQVAFCECGAPLYKWSKPNRHGKNYSYYRCRTRYKSEQGGTCATKPIRCEELDETAESSLLALIGELEAMERRLVPGADHTARLAQVERRIREYRDDREAGLWDDDVESYRGTVARLQEQRAELAAMPQVPDRYEDVPTGRTYREVWSGLETTEEKRAFLLGSGLKVTLHAEPIQVRSLFPTEPAEQSGRISVLLPTDLQRRVQEHASRQAV